MAYFFKPSDSRRAKRRDSKKCSINSLLHIMLDALEHEEKVFLSDLSERIGVEEKLLCYWARIMEKNGMLRFNYGLFKGYFIQKID